MTIRKRKALGDRAFVICVPKRVIPLSTDRSRIKRLIRAAIRIGGLKPPKEVQWDFLIQKKTPKGLKMQEVLQVIQKKLCETP